MRTNKDHRPSPLMRGVAWLLVGTQLIAPYHAALAFAGGQMFARSPEAPAAASRTWERPKLTKFEFSKDPTDGEFYGCQAFEEPLIPVGGPTSSQHNRELAVALRRFISRTEVDDCTALVRFLQEHPTSPWRLSLLINIATFYRQHGYFGRAMDILEKAWAEGGRIVDGPASVLVGLAVGELADLNSRLGRFDRLESLLNEVNDRDFTGSTTEKIAGAREGLWMMKNRPERSFRCGPLALWELKQHAAPGCSAKELQEANSTVRGTSLSQVHRLARANGMEFRMARRMSGKFVTPAVVHWRSGHFASIVEEVEGRFHVKDHTFGVDLWMSAKGLEDEASGYFLIPDKKLPRGWQAVDAKQGDEIWGKGVCNQADPKETRPCDKKEGGSTPCPGMASYSFHAMLVSLSIVDTPLTYSPPFGPSLDFTVYYNQRDAGQGSGLFTWSNLGAKWTFGWMAYISQSAGTENVTYYVDGGGSEDYTSTGAGGGFVTQLKSRTVLHKTSETQYERTLPDGTIQVFMESNSASRPRKLFLSQLIDPQGNSLNFGYDNVTQGKRLRTVTNPLGQTATLDYQLAGDPLKITKVTVDAGIGAQHNGTITRFASFDYNAQGRLIKITDTVGLTSEFTYGSGDFITSLKTPYGTTRFEKEPASSTTLNRWIVATDPLGQKERVEHRINSTGIPSVPATVPDSEIPPASLMAVANANMQYRNSFYWTKAAMQQISNPVFPSNADYALAKTLHWLHLASDVASGLLECEKMPLESRVWYNYPGQTDSTFVPGPGGSGFPSKIGRVLKVNTDGSKEVQLRQFTYSDLGKVTRAVDSAGRVTIFVYAPNGLDLLEVRQVTGATDSVYDVVTAFTYDQTGVPYLRGQPLTYRDPSGLITDLAYNGRGQLQTITSPLLAGQPAREVTTYGYNANGFLTSIDGPVAGNADLVSLTPDSFQRIGTATDSVGYAMTYQYDQLDRLLRITHPDSTYEQVVYERLDPVLTRDRLGRFTGMSFDALRRVTSVTDAEGRTSAYDWCNCGALASITDALNRTTEWRRDLQGRATQKILPDGSKITYSYEPNSGRLKTVTDPMQQITTYDYDADDHVRRVSYSGGAVSTPPVVFNYHPRYDRVSEMIDGIGKTVYDYYPFPTGANTLIGAGRLKSLDGPLNGSTDKITLTYDELGRVRQRDINGSLSTVTYDAMGRASSVVNPLGSFTYHYDAGSFRLADVINPNGTRTDFTYFPAANATHRERLQTLKHSRTDTTVISKFDFTYNSEGQIATWQQQVDAASPKVYEATYDKSDELTSAVLKTTGGSPTVVKQLDYGYDGARNRWFGKVTVPPSAPTSVAFVYNNLNQLIKRTDASLQFAGSINEAGKVTVNGAAALMTGNNFEGFVPGQNGDIVTIKATDLAGNQTTKRYLLQNQTATGETRTLTYDLNGNLVTLVTVVGGTTQTDTYEWDGANRLVAIQRRTGTTLGTRSEFLYDGLGRRVQIIEKAASGSITSSRRFLWCGAEICEERDSSGQSVTKRFYPQGEVRNGVNYYYTRDQLGSVREVVTATGTVAARYDYDPYGLRTQVSGTFDCDFGFTGHFYHAPSVTYLTLFRVYDPVLGRWLSRDPIAEYGGLNLYAYAGNDPFNLVDPYGLDFVDWFARQDWIDSVSNFGAGFGDHYTFGATKWVRQRLGYDDVVDKCSGAYSTGEWVSVGVGLATGAKGAAGFAGKVAAQAGAGRNFNLMRGLGRQFYDNRSWGAVSKMYSRAVGGLKNRGVDLSHTFVRRSESIIPQGIRNAGLNYYEMSSQFNNFLSRHRMLEGMVGAAGALGAANMATSPFRMPGGCGN